MLRDILSNKGVLAGFLFCILIVVGSLLYSWHVERGIKAEETRTQQFLQQLATKKETHAVQDTRAFRDTRTLGQASMPLETDGTQPISDNTDALPIDEASARDEVADAFLPDDVVLEEESTEVPVSPFGFGPYPELPEGWSSFTFPARSANHELMKRVRIKLLSQGINAEGTTMEDGLVYPVIKGIAYVKWKEYERPTGIVRYISRFKGHPEDGARMNTIRFKKGRSLTEVDVPSDIKLVSFQEGGIDPYQFLDLP